MWTLISIINLVLTFACSLSIPGVSTKIYSHGEQVELYLNELDSISNQVPYDPYLLNFCKPHKPITNNFQNLGSLLLGQKTLNSAYQIYLGIEMPCQKVCEMKLNEINVNDFKWFISHDYRVNMELDNLPAIQDKSTEKELTPGYPIGYYEDLEYYINNHVSFEIELYPAGKNEFRIVGFKATPKSMYNVQTKFINDTYVLIPGCEDQQDYLDEEKYPLPQEIIANETIVFSYDVNFTINVNKTHGSRWDNYANLSKENVQWKSLAVTFFIAIFLTGIVAILLKFILRRDILRYRAIAELPQQSEIADQGWKQISRDVFRPPSNPMLFAVLIGTGAQLIALVVSTLFLACIGFFYQAHRGNILTMLIVVFVSTGSMNGYYSARYYKYFKGAYWLLCTLLSNLSFPLILTICEWVVHIFLVMEDSSSTLSFRAVITFVSLWLGIQVPLNLIGSFIGYKLDPAKDPSKPYPIAQPIPPQPWFLEDFYSCVIGGFICFASVGVEFQFIMHLIWAHTPYYFFASLFFTAILLFVISGEVSIIFTYLSLQKGNHKWWWKAFLIPFCAGIYLFVYSLSYYFEVLTFTRLSAIVYYFGTMFLISLVFGLICGTVGLISSYKFVRGIYGLIKHD